MLFLSYSGEFPKLAQGLRVIKLQVSAEMGGMFPSVVFRFPIWVSKGTESSQKMLSQ